LANKEGIALASNGAKLTLEQQQEALTLLKADMPFREVAGRFGVHHESIRQLALREGVELAPRGQKLTPTERKLTPEQQQEARELVDAGVSIRKVAKQFGGESSVLR
jgi:IS30 family transposase